MRQVHINSRKETRFYEGSTEVIEVELVFSHYLYEDGQQQLRITGTIGRQNTDYFDRHGDLAEDFMTLAFDFLTHRMEKFIESKLDQPREHDRFGLAHELSYLDFDFGKGFRK